MEPRADTSTRPATPDVDRSGHPDTVECREVLGILGAIGDRWSVPVIGQLRDRTLRFGELRRAVDGISQRMLTLTLRQLERDGLVTRTVHATVPPRVDYALTELGATLLESVTVFGAWAGAHRREIQDNRRRYDAARPPM